MPDPALRPPPPPERVEVAVIGGGMAGLSAARLIHEAGRRVVLLEASDGLGGRVRTDIVDGHRLDRGFQVLLTAYPELHAQFDVNALQLCRFEPGALVWDGRTMQLVGDPIRRPGTLARTVRARVGSLADKGRVLRQRVRLQRTPARELLRQPDGTTIESLRQQGFSDQIIDQLFRPLVGGIQLDPSLRTSRRAFDVILQSLVKGDAAVPARGMGELPRQLATHLPERLVRLRTPVVDVASGHLTTSDGCRVAADAVVVATEGPEAARLLGLRDVAGNGAAAVWYAAATPPLAGRHIILDASGAGPALNIAVMSNVAPEYAPTGSSLVVAACPGTADGGIEPRVRTQLTTLWGDVVRGWRHLRTYAIEHGQPRQYPPFSPKKPVSMGEGLFVCGDHRDTASIQGALYSGRRCAEAVLAFLT